jgi:hypothetical protein
VNNHMGPHAVNSKSGWHKWRKYLLSQVASSSV